MSLRIAIVSTFLGVLAADSYGAGAASKSAVFPRYAVEVSNDASEIFPLNTHTTLTVTLRAMDGKDSSRVASLGFNARMPEHKHGMVTKPKVSRVGRATFKVEGVKLHMKGKWLLEFTIDDDEGQTFVASPIHIK